MPKPTRTARDAIAALRQRIRDRRKELERTQEQVAFAAGVPVGWCASLERGQRLRPNCPPSWRSPKRWRWTLATYFAV